MWMAQRSKRQMLVKDTLVSLVSLYRPKQQNNLLRRLYRSVMARPFCKLVPLRDRGRLV